MKLNKTKITELIINPDAFVLTNKNIVTKVTNERIKEIIIDTVSKIYERDKSELFVKTRFRKILEPRQMIQFLLKQYTTYSNAEIGFFTGGLDHATVINSRKVWRDLAEVSPPHKERLQQFSVMYHEQIEKEKEQMHFGQGNKCYSPREETIRNWENIKHKYI